MEKDIDFKKDFQWDREILVKGVLRLKTIVGLKALRCGKRTVPESFFCLLAYFVETR